MIDIYYTDIIDIESITTDDWGVKTDTTFSDIPCRIEDLNRLIVNDMGQEVMADILIMLDPAQTLNYGDKIIIKKKNGVAYKQPDKKFIVHKQGIMSNLMQQYNEVYCGTGNR